MGARDGRRLPVAVPTVGHVPPALFGARHPIGFISRCRLPLFLVAAGRRQARRIPVRRATVARSGVALMTRTRRDVLRNIGKMLSSSVLGLRRSKSWVRRGRGMRLGCRARKDQHRSVYPKSDHRPTGADMRAGPPTSVLVIVSVRIPISPVSRQILRGSALLPFVTSLNCSGRRVGRTSTAVSDRHAPPPKLYRMNECGDGDCRRSEAQLRGPVHLERVPKHSGGDEWPISYRPCDRWLERKSV